MEICLLWKYALIQNFHFKMKIQARIIILLKRYLRKISIIHNMYSINRWKSDDYYIIINSNNTEFVNKSNMLVKRLV